MHGLCTSTLMTKSVNSLGKATLVAVIVNWWVPIYAFCVAMISSLPVELSIVMSRTAVATPASVSKTEYVRSPQHSLTSGSRLMAGSSRTKVSPALK